FANHPGPRTAPAKPGPDPHPRGGKGVVQAVRRPSKPPASPSKAIVDAPVDKGPFRHPEILRPVTKGELQLANLLFAGIAVYLILVGIDRGIDDRGAWFFGIGCAVAVMAVFTLADWVNKEIKERKRLK